MEITNPSLELMDLQRTKKTPLGYKKTPMNR